MPSGMQFPHSGDFVFQPQLPNSAAQIHPWPGSATHNNPPLRPTMQKPFDIRAPSLPPDFPKQPHRPFPHGTFRTHAEDHYDRFRPQFDEWNPSDVYSQPRFPPFSNENFGMRNAPLSRMGEMSMDRSYPMANMHGSFLSRPGNDYLPLPRPGRNPLNINPSGPPTYRHTRGQLTYDPFSPTTGSAVHQQQQVTADAKTKNQEKNDPEYEDLMASVGVK
uniref:Uncharacterized protein n=1 Tax=Kalanchoe fedtschenkoi TaxID=63787 RepID=A0A7N0UES2_KALFE